MKDDNIKSPKKPATIVNPENPFDQFEHKEEKTLLVRPNGIEIQSKNTLRNKV